MLIVSASLVRTSSKQASKQASWFEFPYEYLYAVPLPAPSPGKFVQG